MLADLRKCDGSTPCSRCKSDNAICIFGERKRASDIAKKYDNEDYSGIKALREAHENDPEHATKLRYGQEDADDTELWKGFARSGTPPHDYGGHKIPMPWDASQWVAQSVQQTLGMEPPELSFHPATLDFSYGDVDTPDQRSHTM